MSSGRYIHVKSRNTASGKYHLGNTSFNFVGCGEVAIISGNEFLRNVEYLHFLYGLPAIARKIIFDGILLMLDIHAKYVPWTMTNITRVDAKREFLI